MSATFWRLQTFTKRQFIAHQKTICSLTQLVIIKLHLNVIILVGIEKGLFEEKVHLKAGTVKITFRPMCTPSIRQNIY